MAVIADHTHDWNGCRCMVAGCRCTRHQWGEGDVCVQCGAGKPTCALCESNRSAASSDYGMHIYEGDCEEWTPAHTSWNISD